VKGLTRMDNQHQEAMIQQGRFQRKTASSFPPHNTRILGSFDSGIFIIGTFITLYCYMSDCLPRAVVKVGVPRGPGAVEGEGELLMVLVLLAPHPQSLEHLDRLSILQQNENHSQKTSKEAQIHFAMDIDHEGTCFCSVFLTETMGNIIIRHLTLCIIMLVQE